jgi:V/A-type H+/Na+-transporting ATPase subunit C
MFAALSSNVVLAKARTMYGRRLKEADYSELLKCRSVGEVAGYLKNHTVYGKACAGIAESEVHRGELESRLKQKLMDDYASLCKYEAQVDKTFSRSFIQHDEIQLLLDTVMRLNAKNPVKEDHYFPPYLLHGSQLNLNALVRAKNVEDLKNVIQGTPYEELMGPFLEDENARIDYTELENVLYRYHYSGLMRTISKHFFGNAKKQLLSIYQSKLDLSNYVRIVRMKIQYGTDVETAKKALLPTGTFSKETLEKMLQGNTEEEIQSVLEHMELGRKALRVRHVYLDEIPDRMNYELCRHFIDFSIYPAVVLISYIFLSQTEISNIVTIIEGKRYGLEAEEIKKLLILEGLNFNKVGQTTQKRA